MKQLLILFLFIGLGLQAQYHEAIQKLHIKGKFNGTALVIKNDSVVLKEAYGAIDRDTTSLLKTSTTFRIASITKSFTAVAIMQLKEKELLSLNDTVNKFLPNFPYKGITIKQLLTHTSGLPDYLNWMAKNWKPEIDWWETERYIPEGDSLFNAFIKSEQPILFEPGKKWSYSNTGYHILTQIIEKLSGLDYEVYMQENIFEPLEMTSTYIVDTTPVCCNYAKASRAYGYWKKNKKTIYQHDKHFINPMITGDGSIFSNVDDLAKWNYALYTNKLLSDSSIKEITFPHVQMKKGSKNYYGYGWSFRKTKWNTKVNHHTGHWVGFKSYMIRDLDKHHCIILLTNNSVKG